MFTDEHLLEQVFYNLLLNAIEAAPSQSELEIQADISKNLYACISQIEDRGCLLLLTRIPPARDPPLNALEPVWHSIRIQGV